MATERQVPGGPYVNEVTTTQEQIPGAQMVNEYGNSPAGGTGPDADASRFLIAA